MKAYNILIVEDSKLINDNLTKSLGMDGHQVDQAYDATTALKKLKESIYDYVLLDLILPDDEGETLLPFAKKADTKVIVMTTDRDSFRRDRLFSFGIVDYIIKDRYFEDILNGLRDIIKQVETNSEYTLLVVDDSTFIRNHVVMLLQNRGYNVVSAIDGAIALKIMMETNIDALIADLEMPVMDGFQLLAQVRRKKEYKKLPVVILTGSNNSGLIAKVIKHGVKDLIKKPYIIEEMLLKIDTMMNGVKQESVIADEQNKFSLYNRALTDSTLCMRLSSDLRVNYINEAFRELLFDDSSIDTKVGIFDLLAKREDRLLDALKSLSIEQVPYKNTLEFKSSNGTIVYILLTISLVQNRLQEEMEFLLIGQDITEIEMHQQNLQEQVRTQIQINLEQQQAIMNQAKMAAMGEMIGNIAHQWRQPLNALGLLVQDIEDAYSFNELDQEYIQKMSSDSMKQINFMSKTIDDFRNFFEPNKIKENFIVFDAIEETIDIIGNSLKNSDISIKLLSRDKKIKILSYKNELQQVLLNLLNNAKDAIEENSINSGTGEKWIRVETFEKEEEIRVTIEDSGGGIPVELMERVSEPYFTTKDEGKGTGIGLYMSKVIVEKNMQGRLSIANASKGALFTVSLPKKLNNIEQGD